ncbi:MULTISPECIES: M36 family metallopeptidase [unclassified Myxococcus]|uniref:M36 family metallopeptidase n=1 Tax=unclassified Myxococcus TaxID=2648731 RepID=UPI001CBC00D3|nr:MULTISPECIES: M36 family metallopeptidase [unclassified Myxococcus]
MSQGHFRRRLTQALVLMGVCSAPSAFAVVQGSEGVRSHDARVAHNQGLRQGLSAKQQDKAAQLRKSVPELRVEHDATTGLVRSLVNPVGALTSPLKGDALAVGLTFVQNQYELLGLELKDLASLEVTDRVYSRQTGITHLYLRQTHEGLPLYNGQLQINVDSQGRVLSVHSDFLPSLARSVASIQPRLGAAAAVTGAARHLGLKLATAPRALEKQDGPRQRTRVEQSGLSTEPIDAELALLPIRPGDARLVWNFQVHTPDSKHVYDLTVDANTGEVWTRFDWTASDAYSVYRRPVESPIHNTPLPPMDGRLSLLNPANLIASPYGWHDTDGIPGAEYTLHRGNNVHAYDDSANADVPPLLQPDCGPGLTCSFLLDLTQDPSTYKPAAITNLFYWNNIIHDIQYQYGFDEAAGNFQHNTYGNGGLGNDSVRAEAQDGYGLNNAYFTSPPDGQRPRMEMFVWNQTFPRRDGDLDSGIIVHEYGHGISNRQVGGPSNANCLQNNQQPGEGISDFLALMYTARPTDTGPQGRGMGTYAMGQPTTGLGIRTKRYSTNQTVNNWTYASINGMAVPHGVGSVFAQAMWEAYWSLVDRWGFSTNLYNAAGGAGNQRMMLYFNEGLKNTPCGPTFTQVRDGIITAATALNNGEDVCRLWTAFADFGLGVDANSVGPASTAPVNGFNVPAACKTDVWGKDKPWDTGAEPDAATAANGMWESEDIWVRTTATPGPHENPEAGQPNFVHVKVRNRSTVDAHNVMVKVYGTAAATSTSWPNLWVEIGEAKVVHLPAGADDEVVVQWNPAAAGHYCLLARLVTRQDPMTHPELGNPDHNTRQNNNIIWRNTNVVNLIPFGFSEATFILRNTLTEGRLFNLRFQDRTVQAKRPLLERGGIVVDLGRELMEHLKAQGGEIEGLEQVGETRFEVTDPTKARIAIRLEPEQEFPVGLQFRDREWKEGKQTDDFVQYEFAAVLEDPKHEEAKTQDIGGVTYYVRMSVQ